MPSIIQLFNYFNFYRFKKTAITIARKRFHDAISTIIQNSQYPKQMITLRNLILSLCIGSIVAIAVNIGIGPSYKFSSTAFALGFFVFSALFAIKPIKVKE